MKIQIDLKDIEASGLTGGQYLFMLNLMVNKRTAPFIVSTKELNELIIDGYIKGSALTDKAISLFRKNIKTADDEFIKELLREMRDMFPKGVTTGNKLVRSTVNGALVQRMRKFIQENDFNRDVIIEATERYVNNCKKDGYKFMRALVYFIGKQGENSDLADYCIAIKEGFNNGRQSTEYNPGGQSL